MRDTFGGFEEERSNTAVLNEEFSCEQNFVDSSLRVGLGKESSEKHGKRSRDKFPQSGFKGENRCVIR